jgi:DNA-binding transcriptional MerR regulator
MPLNSHYSPAEVCELFDISKSTLLRWEREGTLPAPSRNAADQREPRVYSQRDVQIIARKQEDELGAKYQAASRRLDEYKRDGREHNLERLQELMQLRSLRKFLAGNDLGLAELSEYPHLQPRALRVLLRLALEHSSPEEPVFAHILRVVAEQSAKLQRRLSEEADIRHEGVRERG